MQRPASGYCSFSAYAVASIARTKPDRGRSAVAHECETYSQLLPEREVLSATLFVEIPTGGNIRYELERLLGLDRSLFLDIGGERVQAVFDGAQLSEHRISAVHYVRFPLTQAQRAAFLDRKVAAKLVVVHPALSAEAVIDGETRRSLAGDLA